MLGSSPARAPPRRAAQAARRGAAHAMLDFDWDAAVPAGVARGELAKELDGMRVDKMEPEKPVATMLAHKSPSGWMAIAGRSIPLNVFRDFRGFSIDKNPIPVQMLLNKNMVGSAARQIASMGFIHTSKWTMC